MFITLTSDQVQFNYGSKQLHYQFEEIAQLTLLKKKKIYFLENATFIAITALAYYIMVFSDVNEMYYIVPTLFCYTIIIVLRFQNPSEFEYYLVVRNIYQKETKIKIKAEHKNIIAKQVDAYLDVAYHRILKKNA